MNQQRPFSWLGVALCVLAVVALTISAQPSPVIDEDVACVVHADGSSSCHPKVFVPTEGSRYSCPTALHYFIGANYFVIYPLKIIEFQPIIDGQEVPSGLHIRLNLETGMREAKLVSPHDDNNHAAFELQVGEESAEEVPVPPDTPVSVHGKENPYKHPSRDRLTPHEVTALGVVIDSLNNSTTEEILDTLDFLEEATLVLGTALSNNPAVQAAGADHSLLSTLLSHLQSETDPKCLNRFIYALGALVRSNHAALREFHQREGLSILARLFQQADDITFKQKLVSLVMDILDRDMIADGKGELSESPAELLAWCDILQSVYEDPALISTVAGNALRGIVHILRSNANSCPNMRTWVAVARDGDVLEDHVNSLNEIHRLSR
ncbi:hypothetical protein HK104_008537 [Borealophlyctis nickersoniae]|nr:hypothetical protein HK104_008537 [Borealophlyctis nickersoniae]